MPITFDSEKKQAVSQFTCLKKVASRVIYITVSVQIYHVPLDFISSICIIQLYRPLRGLRRICLNSRLVVQVLDV